MSRGYPPHSLIHGRLEPSIPGAIGQRGTPMRRYRLEVADSAEGQPHRLGLFPTRAQAREALRTEWKQWRELAATPDFRPSLSKLNGGTEFLVQTPSGQEIVYRIRDVIG